MDYWLVNAFIDLAKKTWFMECRKAVAEAGRWGSFHRQDAGLEAVSFSSEINLSFLQISDEVNIQ